MHSTLSKQVWNSDLLAVRLLEKHYGAPAACPAQKGKEQRYSWTLGKDFARPEAP